MRPFGQYIEDGALHINLLFFILMIPSIVMLELPDSLKRELHPLCDLTITAKVLNVVRSNSAVCIQEVAKAVDCSDITARKNLIRLVRAGLAVEKRIGKVRVFIKSEEIVEGVRA